jgi:hypothetical protein
MKAPGGRLLLSLLVAGIMGVGILAVLNMLPLIPNVTEIASKSVAAISPSLLNQPADSSAGVAENLLTIANGRLSAKLRNRPAPEIAGLIAELSGIKVQLADSIQEARLSADIAEQPTEDALRRLFSAFDTVFLYEGSDDNNRSGPLRMILVYPKGQGSGLLQPSPESRSVSNPLALLAQQSPRGQAQSVRISGY